jgi:hypothetical protein
MSDAINPIPFFDTPTVRRLWLLAQALRSLPLDQALELARAAEAFLTQCESATSTSALPGQKQLIASPPAEAKDGGFVLTHDQRDRMLDRLAAGGRNAELAAEFGLSAKQVQGVRMGCAREIAKRRTALAAHSPAPAQQQQVTGATASIDEIVRDLRQQDDVVVPQEDGGYLVNGRFRMTAAELTLRANRMRGRQGRPAFDLRSAPLPLQTGAAPKSHPVFWEDPATTEPAPNGFHRPTEIDTEGA